MGEKLKNKNIVFNPPIAIKEFKKKKFTLRSGIYLLKNNYNNRVYVGSAVDLIRRNVEHKKLLKSKQHVNTFLLNDYKKHQLAPDKIFTFLIKELVSNENDLLKEEQKYIDTYYDNQKKCYNLAPKAGSSIGVKWSKNSKLLHSKKRKGIGNPMWGKRHSLKTRNLMAERQKKSVGQYCLNGNLIKIFPSITEAAKNIGVSRQMIGHCCNGNRKTGKGYKWRFINE